jgi:hypothetical protein
MNRLGRIGTAAALATAGALMLGTPARAADVYNACFNTLKQKVRASTLLVNATPICKATEALHTWNEDGPQGPQGPQGVPGVENCGPEEITGTCNANQFAVLNLTCSGTKHAVGASAIWHSPFDAADNGPFYILPRTDNTWTFVPYNHTGISQQFRAFLQCCD